VALGNSCCRFCSSKNKGVVMDKFQFIYWLSNTVVIMTLLIGIRFRKQVGIKNILVLLFLVFTSFHWDYSREDDFDFDDALYDIAFMIVSVALIVCSFKTQDVCFKSDCKHRLSRGK